MTQVLARRLLPLTSGHHGLEALRWMQPGLTPADGMVEPMELPHHSLSPTASESDGEKPSKKARICATLLEQPTEFLTLFRENLHQGALRQAWMSSDTKVVWERVLSPSREGTALQMNLHTPNLKRVLQGRPPKGMLVCAACCSPAFLLILRRQANREHIDSARELLQYMKRCTSVHIWRPMQRPPATRGRPAGSGVGLRQMRGDAGPPLMALPALRARSVHDGAQSGPRRVPRDGQPLGRAGGDRGQAPPTLEPVPQARRPSHVRGLRAGLRAGHRHLQPIGGGGGRERL